MDAIRLCVYVCSRWRPPLDVARICCTLTGLKKALLKDRLRGMVTSTLPVCVTVSIGEVVVSALNTERPPWGIRHLVVRHSTCNGRSRRGVDRGTQFRDVSGGAADVAAARRDRRAVPVVS